MAILCGFFTGVTDILKYFLINDFKLYMSDSATCNRSILNLGFDGVFIINEVKLEYFI